MAASTASLLAAMAGVAPRFACRVAQRTYSPRGAVAAAATVTVRTVAMAAEWKVSVSAMSIEGEEARRALAAREGSVHNARVPLVSNTKEEIAIRDQVGGREGAGGATGAEAPAAALNIPTARGVAARGSRARPAVSATSMLRWSQAAAAHGQRTVGRRWM